MRPQLIASLALLIVTVTAEAAERDITDGLRPILQADLSGTIPKTDVRLVLLVTNDDYQCRTIYFDPYFSPFELDNRGVQIVIEVRDEMGKVVLPHRNPSPDVIALSPGELVPLQCGNIYGVRIKLTSATSWGYTLSAGLYKARARIHFTTRDLFEHQPNFATRFASLHKLTLERAKQALADGDVVSEWCSFTIGH